MPGVTKSTPITFLLFSVVAWNFNKTDKILILLDLLLQTLVHPHGKIILLLILSPYFSTFAVNERSTYSPEKITTALVTVKFTKIRKYVYIWCQKCY